MSSDWTQITTDQILNSGAPTESHAGLQYDRILQHRLTEKLAGLTETIDRTGRAFAGKTDESGAKYHENARAQTRQQWLFGALTLVIAIATVTYTWINWEVREAMREANQIQRQMLAVQQCPQEPRK
jgi:hypothetical protein